MHQPCLRDSNDFDNRILHYDTCICGSRFSLKQSVSQLCIILVRRNFHLRGSRYCLSTTTHNAGKLEQTTKPCSIISLFGCGAHSSKVLPCLNRSKHRAPAKAADIMITRVKRIHNFDNCIADLRFLAFFPMKGIENSVA